MVDMSATIGDDNGNDVESDVNIQVLVSNIGVCGPNEHFLFIKAHGDVRIAIDVRLTAFHFHNDQFIAIKGNDIDFFMARSPIAFENLVPFLGKEIHCNFLTLLPEFL